MSSNRTSRKRNGCKSSKSPPTNDDSTGCAFCGLNEDNENKYGKLYRKYGLTVHYFCMLFSSALNQNGRHDSDGISGFLKLDVEKELKRGAKLKCHYCKKNGATVGCSLRRCGKKFHLPCGIQNDTLQQYFGSFCAFCPDHRPKQELPTSDRLSFHGTANSTCPICLSSIEARTSNNTLRSPCCKNSWFHRNCIQEQALNAGYFFKCPLCNNKEIFQLEMLTYGVYIPEQDASWERETNAFQDLLYRHDQCDFPTCKCPKGRRFSQDSGKWAIILCKLCGSQGCHIGCGRLSFYSASWECTECTAIFKTLKGTKLKEKKGKRKADDSAGSSVSCSESQASTSTSSSSQAAGTKRPRIMDTGDHIVERIRFYQMELRKICQQAQSKTQSSSASSKLEDSLSTLTTPNFTSSSGSDIVVLKRRPAVIYESDDESEIDVVSCDNSKVLLQSEALRSAVDNSCSAYLLHDSDEDIEVANDLDLRLLPTDFPSPPLSRKSDDDDNAFSGSVVRPLTRRMPACSLSPFVTEDAMNDENMVTPVHPLSSTVVDTECNSDSIAEASILLKSKSNRIPSTERSNNDDQRTLPACETTPLWGQIHECVTPRKEDSRNDVNLLPVRLSDILVTPEKINKTQKVDLFSTPRQSKVNNKQRPVLECEISPSLEKTNVCTPLKKEGDSNGVNRSSVRLSDILIIPEKIRETCKVDLFSVPCQSKVISDQWLVPKCEIIPSTEQLNVRTTLKKEEDETGVNLLSFRLCDILVRSEKKSEALEVDLLSSSCQSQTESCLLNNETISRLDNTKDDGIQKCDLGSNFYDTFTCKTDEQCANNDVPFTDMKNTVPENDSNGSEIPASFKDCIEIGSSSDVGDVDVPKENTVGNMQQISTTIRKKKKKKKKKKDKCGDHHLLEGHIKKAYKRKKKCKYQQSDWDHSVILLENADSSHSDSVCDIPITGLTISDVKCDNEEEVVVV